MGRIGWWMFGAWLVAACSSSSDDPTPGDCELGSPTDCSACGDACPSTAPLCAPGGDGFECVAQCGATDSECGGRCVDTQTDIRHCGVCDTPCVFANGEAACVGGACTLAGCITPFDDCNDTSGDGCELLVTSETDCGMCGNTCEVDERCIDLACNPCPATNPAVSGSHNDGPCRIDAQGNAWTLIDNTEDGCDDDSGALTFSDVTTSGTSGSISRLCRIEASGSSVVFIESEDGSCDAEAGTITVSGATVSGTVDGRPCGIQATGSSIEFFEDDDGSCDRAIGTIVLSPVCL